MMSSYVGNISKVMPHLGYMPYETCFHGSKPNTNKHILGLDIFKNLKHTIPNNGGHGRF